MDLRFALRSLRKNPGVAVLAVVVMALGIGANSAVFSVVNTVLLKPLAYRDPDQIVTLFSLWKKDNSHGQVSAPDFHDWHDQSSLFSAMAYYDTGNTAVTVGSGAEYAQASEVTPDFFRVFEMRPVLGRLFTQDEEKPGSSGAAIISHSFWESHFGANQSTIGGTLRMFGRTLNIIAVLPVGFHFPDKTDIW